MRNIPDAANTPGAPGGNYESLMGRAGELLQGDSAKDLQQLREALKKLKSEKLDQLAKSLEEQIKKLSEQAGQIEGVSEGMEQILPAMTEYQKQQNREAREDRSLSEVGERAKLAQKASQLSGDNKDIQGAKDAASSKWKNLGDLSNVGIEELVMYIMMAASRDAHEDLKSMLDQVKALQKRKSGARKIMAAGAGLLLVVGLIMGPQFINPPEPDSGPPEPNANVPAVQQPAAVPIGAAPGCKISLTSPASAVELPPSGPVHVEWSSDPHGLSYTLEIQPPSGEPWQIPTDEDSKNVYMENFPAGGTYQFTVSTLDAHGAVLCSVVVSFEKPASDEAPAIRKNAGDGTYCDPNGMIGC